MLQSSVIWDGIFLTEFNWWILIISTLSPYKIEYYITIRHLLNFNSTLPETLFFSIFFGNLIAMLYTHLPIIFVIVHSFSTIYPAYSINTCLIRSWVHSRHHTSTSLQKGQLDIYVSMTNIMTREPKYKIIKDKYDSDYNLPVKN